MDVLTSEEIHDLVNSSDLVKKYKNEVDKESAYEILAKATWKQAAEVEQEVAQEKSTARQPKKSLECSSKS